jgi:putative DNA primase/helicase
MRGETGPVECADPAEDTSSTMVRDALVVARLATLDPFEYDRCREDEARKLGIRAQTLDAQVKPARAANVSAARGAGAVVPSQGRPLDSPVIEPWPDPVDGAELLDDLTEVIRRFVIVGLAAARATALWVVFTHAFAAAHFAPKLCITSPQKRSGKTRLIEALAYLVARPRSAAHLTAAALFRVIEDHCPTLLIDEADTFMRDNGELRGLVNSGFSKETARVLRAVPVGDGWEVREFSTWCPQAISGIGRLADTIMDRSFVIEMKRKLPTERVGRLRRRDAGPLIDLARKAARFAADHLDEIQTSIPDMPAGLNDRAADAWETCVAIADVADGNWPILAREAALALSGDGVVEDESIGVMLLYDIRAAFTSRDADRLPSVALVDYLVALEERPWAEFGKAQKPITKSRVASLLKSHKIKPGSIRIGPGPENTIKGYYRHQFDDAFARHLAPIPSENVTPSQVADPAGPGDFRSVTPPENVTDEHRAKLSNSAGCDVVPDCAPLGDEIDDADIPAEAEGAI